MVEDEEDADAKVLDEALLRLVAKRLGDLTLVESVSVFPATKSESVVAQLDRRHYPERIDRATLELRAYLDGAFHITYREEWNGQSWLCRWDRHANPHSDRDHCHQPPDARTADTVDRDYPIDFLDVLELVLEDVDDRLGEVWDQDHLVD
jgi:hypothetical protein